MGERRRRFGFMDDQLIRDLFERVTRALRDGDYRMVASLCDPVSLSLFKRGHVEQIASFRTTDWSAEEMMRSEPDMPREVAQYNVARWRQHRAEHNPLAHEFPRVASIDDLRALDPVDVFTEWLYGRSPEHALEKAVARSDVPAEEIEYARAHLNKWAPTFELCCVVRASDRIAEIVFRRGMEQDGTELTDEEVDPEWAELRAQADPDEVMLQDDLALLPLDFAQCRMQPDGSWKMIADDKFLTGRDGWFYIGWESS